MFRYKQLALNNLFFCCEVTTLLLSCYFIASYKTKERWNFTQINLGLPHLLKECEVQTCIALVLVVDLMCYKRR